LASFYLNRWKIGKFSQISVLFSTKKRFSITGSQHDDSLVFLFDNGIFFGLYGNGRLFKQKNSQCMLMIFGSNMNIWIRKTVWFWKHSENSSSDPWARNRELTVFTCDKTISKASRKS
jgi:hypothetical protein